MSLLNCFVLRHIFEIENYLRRFMYSIFFKSFSYVEMRKGKFIFCSLLVWNFWMNLYGGMTQHTDSTQLLI